jgi:hypothetical protein
VVLFPVRLQVFKISLLSFRFENETPPTCLEVLQIKPYCLFCEKIINPTQILSTARKLARSNDVVYSHENHPKQTKLNLGKNNRKEQKKKRRIIRAIIDQASVLDLTTNCA